MIKRARVVLTIGGATGLLLAALSLPAQAINIEVNMTVDNSYALFYGTGTAATNFVGSDFDWTSTETYTFNLPAGKFLYCLLYTSPSPRD